MDRSEMLRRLKNGEDPLDLSIEKWQDIVDGKGKDEGADNCALCELYNHFLCKKCLVRKATGHDSCGKTPYENRVNYSNAKTWAEAEVEFLRSLKEAKK